MLQGSVPSHPPSDQAALPPTPLVPTPPKTEAGGAVPPTGHPRCWRSLALLLSLLTFFLSGCFKYDLTLQFDSQTHGQIVQQIQLSERAVALGGSAVQDWLSGLESRVRRLGGQVDHPTQETLRLVVPFSNGTQLVQRFNHLFQSEQPTGLPIANLATVPSQFSLTQQNRILAIRNHLTFDLDLRTLPRQPQTATGLIGSTADWLDLRFTLQVPWGLRPGAAEALPLAAPGPSPSWPLQPGEINHIDVTFWVPSPIGLGALAIAAVVLLGYFGKYGLRRRRRPVNIQ